MLFVNTMNQSNEHENHKIVVQANILIERQHNSCATTLEPREMYISSTWDKIIKAKYIYKRQQSKKEITWIAIAGKNYKGACNGWRVIHMSTEPPT